MTSPKVCRIVIGPVKPGRGIQILYQVGSNGPSVFLLRVWTEETEERTEAGGILEEEQRKRPGTSEDEIPSWEASEEEG